MHCFNDTYHNFIKSIISEGGLAVPDVDRIQKKYIFNTIAKFKKEIIEPLFGDLKDSIFTLGSTGKKASSGDIDLAIDINALPDKNILTNMINLVEVCAKNGYNSCINTFNYDMVHIAYPQTGNKSKNVQIDVLFTEVPEYVKFYMYSPDEKSSKYKGAHRNDLLNAILKSFSYKSIEKKGREDIKWEVIALDESGLAKCVKSLVDANGNRLKYKNAEPLLKSYAKDEQRIPISTDIDYIIWLTVGEGYSIDDIDSFEKLFDIVKNDSNFRYSKNSEEILKICAESLKESKFKLEFPKELRSYLKK